MNVRRSWCGEAPASAVLAAVVAVVSLLGSVGCGSTGPGGASASGGAAAGQGGGGAPGAGGAGTGGASSGPDGGGAGGGGAGGSGAGVAGAAGAGVGGAAGGAGAGAAGSGGGAGGGPWRIAVGGQQACAVSAGGVAYCWGANVLGLAQPDIYDLDSAAPVDITPVAQRHIVDIAVSEGMVCALKDEGSVFCVDQNGGQIVPGIGGAALQICLEADGIGCAVRSDGNVFCWGGNGSGVPAAQESGVQDAVAIACGSTTACALQRDGTVWCWGGGWGTQDASAPEGESPRLVPEFGSDVAALAGGEGGICALYSAGTGICIGSVFGVEMRGGSAPATPVGVPALDGARAVAIGDRHVCAVGSDDALRCWGANDLGQLGDGTFTAHTVPALASSLDDGPATILQLAAGEGVTCASFSDGLVRCVGSNDHGALGDGRALSVAAVPVELPAGANLTSYQAAIDTTAFAVQSDGSVVAWGGLPSAVVPQGGPALQAAAPVPIAAPPAEPATEQAAVSTYSACLRGSDGAVRCLQSSPPATFTVVSGLASGVVDLNASCVVPAAGGVRCGVGHTGYSPSGSASTGAVAALASGAAGGCLLRPDGTVECWPESNMTTGAQQVQDLGGPAIAIAVGDEGCALRSDGAVLCWTIDQFDAVPSAQYVQLPAAAYGITAASGMVCGRGTCSYDSTHGHVCAWTAAGDLYCWGDNNFGQLGDGTTVTRTGFVRATVPGGAVLSASAGNRQTCAVRAADKRLICWGWNGAGELGDGTGGPQATAVTVGLP